jgi:hypothetical protein
MQDSAGWTGGCAREWAWTCARGRRDLRSQAIEGRLRIATDEAGEIYILTKSDGLIRRITSIR